MTFDRLFVILQTMTSPEQQKKEVRLYMERATQMLAVAKHNLAGDFYESSVNRSYYAVFYAASALLTTQEKSMSRHAGVISALKCTALVGTGRLVMNNLALPIQSLTNEEEMAVQQFIFELKQQFKDAIYAITLYGSKARGDALVDSDIDLLIVMDSDAWETRNRAAIPGALCKSTRGRDRFCGKIFTKTSRFYLWERELLEIG